MEIQLLLIPSDSQSFNQEAEKAPTPTSQHWVVTDNETSRRVKYIFRPNGDILTTPLSVRPSAKAE